MKPISTIFDPNYYLKVAGRAAAPIVAKNIENTINLVKDFYGLKTGLSLLDPFNIAGLWRRTSVDETPTVVRIAVRPMVRGSNLASIIFGERDREHLHYPNDFKENGQLEESGAKKIAWKLQTQMFYYQRYATKNREHLGIAKEVIAQSIIHPSTPIEKIVNTIKQGAVLSMEAK